MHTIQRPYLPALKLTTPGGCVSHMSDIARTTCDKPMHNLRCDRLKPIGPLWAVVSHNITMCIGHSHLYKALHEHLGPD